MAPDELLAAVNDDRGWPTRDGGYRLLDDFTAAEAVQLLGWLRSRARELHQRATHGRPGGHPRTVREWFDSQPLPARLAALANTAPTRRRPAEERAIHLLRDTLGAQELTRHG